MNPREKLHPQIETLVDSMMGYLRDAAPVHMAATSRAILDDDTDPEGSAITGGSLKGEKQPPIRHNSSALVAAYRRFFKDAITVGVPMHLIEFSFRRGESGWTYDVALETSAAYRALEQARAPLDQEVIKAMVAAANGDWTRIDFEQRLPAAAKLTIFKGRERREGPLTPELETLLKRAFELYTQHGRQLRWPLWRVEGGPGEYDVETEMYYG